MIWLMLVLTAQAGDPSDKVAGKDAEWLSKKLTKEDDAVMRAAIVKEMGLTRNAALLPEMLRAADDRDAKVRAEALLALGNLGGSLDDDGRDAAYARGVEDANQKVREAAIKGAASRFQAGSAKLEGLSEALLAAARKASSWQARHAAIQAVEHAEHEEVNKTLIDAARLDDNPEVRRAAAVALGSRGAAEASEVLSGLRSRDPEESVRLAAEKALAQIGGKATAVVVAVMPFDTRASAQRKFASTLQDYFTTALAGAKVASVVERRQVATVMKEMVFQDKNINDGQAVQVGKMLRANQVVTGSLQVQGSAVTCLAKRIDVVTSEVVASVEANGQLHDLDALKRECASRLTRSF